MTHLEMYRGDDRRLTITASESLEGSTIRFTAKHSRADVEPVIAKSTTEGSVVIGDPDTTTAVVHIDAADTDDLTAPVPLRWDVEITDIAGKIRTVADGVLDIKADVTRPPSGS